MFVNPGGVRCRRSRARSRGVTLRSRAVADSFDATGADDRTPRLSSIETPTFVGHGDRDRLIPIDNGRALAAAIPNARLHVLEGCSHLPSWEATEELVEVTDAFFRE